MSKKEKENKALPKTTNPKKELDVVYDSGLLTHDTGDTYEGSFEVRRKDRSFKMQGPGVYTTAEGDIYAGTWDQNKLIGTPEDEVTITYHSGAKYEGCFKDGVYSGKGRYTYPDGSVLSCTFADNCPQGQLTLTDPNEHDWRAQPEQGFAWFEPMNHYYTLLERTIEKKKKLKKIKTEIFPEEPVEKKKIQNVTFE